MKLVITAPINKGIFKENLTYFSSLDVVPGSIVTVPVGTKKVDALVVETRELGQAKSEVKRSDFSLKKIEGVKYKNFFRPEFIAATKQAADYFASNLGQTLRSLVPTAILEGASGTVSKDKASVSRSKATEEDDATIKQYRFVLQEPEDERVTFYKSLIRETFAKKNSVFLCLPTARETEKMAELFGKGISDYTITLSSNLSKKAVLENWNKALENKHSVLVIATPQFLSLPREDIALYIFDHESSGAYKEMARPFIDYRVFGEFLAKETGARVIMGDVALRSETIFETEKGKYSPISAIKYRFPSGAQQIIIDPRKEKIAEKTKMSALAIELTELLTSEDAERERVFIFSGRKGLSQMTICSDCGNTILCEKCNSPLVIHKNEENSANKMGKYIYLCHKCGTIRNVTDKCPTCDSWRLLLASYGIEKIEEELGALFPERTIFRLDGDSAGGQKKTRETIAKFYNTPRAILIGTEFVLPYLSEKIDNVVMANVDSLFSIPDFRISEKLIGLTIELRQLATKRFIVQTRKAEEKVFTYALSGNLLDFYRDEIAERMKFAYPPLKTMVKISRAGKKSEVTADMAMLEEKLKVYDPLVYPAFTSTTKAGYLMHSLIKLPPENWPNPELLALLRSLPPAFIINVLPENIL